MVFEARALAGKRGSAMETDVGDVDEHRALAWVAGSLYA
jgi:hypothetical protein